MPPPPPHFTVCPPFVADLPIAALLLQGTDTDGPAIRGKHTPPLDHLIVTVPLGCGSEGQMGVCAGDMEPTLRPRHPAPNVTSNRTAKHRGLRGDGEVMSQYRGAMGRWDMMPRNWGGNGAMGRDAAIQGGDGGGGG